MPLFPHLPLVLTHAKATRTNMCMYVRICMDIYKYDVRCIISRLTIVSREAKKKQAVRDEQVSYLHVAPL